MLAFASLNTFKYAVKVLSPRKEFVKTLNGLIISLIDYRRIWLRTIYRNNSETVHIVP